MKSVTLTQEELDLLKALYEYLNEEDFQQIYYDEDDEKMEAECNHQMDVFDSIINKLGITRG